MTSMTAAVIVRRMRDGLRPPILVNANALYAPTLELYNPLELGPVPLIANDNVLGALEVELTITLNLGPVPLIANVNTLGSLEIENIIIQELEAPLLVNTNSLNAPEIQNYTTLDLTAPSIVNTNTLYAPDVQYETSYSYLGGIGDRTALITVTASGGPTGGTYSNWVDGLLGQNSSDSWWWSSSGSHWLKLNFTTMNADGVIIDEIRFKQSAATTHATYQLQGSNDDSSWTNIGSPFVLGGATTQTVQFPHVNKFTYYRMERTTGSLSNAPYMQEIELKISYTLVPSDLFVSQLAIETMLKQTANLRVTQLAIEVIAPIPPAIEPTEETDLAYDGPLVNGYNPEDTHVAGILDSDAFIYAGFIRGTGTSRTDVSNARSVNPILGKRYWEVVIINASGTGSADQAVGIGLLSEGLENYLGETIASVGWFPSGTAYHNGSSIGSAGGGSWTTGDRLMIAYDATTRELWFGKNGTWAGDPAAGTGEKLTLPSGTYYVMDSVRNGPQEHTTIFAAKNEPPAFGGQMYAAPTGFEAFFSRWEFLEMA